MELHSDSGGPGLQFAQVMEGFFSGAVWSKHLVSLSNF